MRRTNEKKRASPSDPSVQVFNVFAAPEAASSSGHAFAKAKVILILLRLIFHFFLGGSLKHPLGGLGNSSSLLNTNSSCPDGFIIVLPQYRGTPNLVLFYVKNVLFLVVCMCGVVARAMRCS